MSCRACRGFWLNGVSLWRLVLRRRPHPCAPHARACSQPCSQPSLAPSFLFLCVPLRIYYTTFAACLSRYSLSSAFVLFLSFFYVTATARRSKGADFCLFFAAQPAMRAPRCLSCLAGLGWGGCAADTDHDHGERELWVRSSVFLVPPPSMGGTVNRAGVLVGFLLGCCWVLVGMLLGLWLGAHPKARKFSAAATVVCARVCTHDTPARLAWPAPRKEPGTHPSPRKTTGIRLRAQASNTGGHVCGEGSRLDSGLGRKRKRVQEGASARNRRDNLSRTFQKEKRGVSDTLAKPFGGLRIYI